MPVEILHESMLRIASADRNEEQLGSGYGGRTGPAEGPVWIHEEGHLLFSDIHNSRRMRWTPGKGVAVDKDETAKGNGQTRDRAGRLIVCHHLGRCVDAEDLDTGEVTMIADAYKGYKLNRPNDVVVKSDGAVYFTDPPPKIPLTPEDHYPEQDCAGVYRVSPDGKRINRIVGDFVNPNGLCFSPDEKVLYINDSSAGRKHIRAFNVEADGMLDLGSDRLFCDMNGDDRRGFPDGMKCDVEGNLYCTGPGGIWVLDPDGVHIGTILSEHIPINLNWGDEDWRTLYFAGWSSINRIRLDIPGIPVPRGAIA
ncbi:MAG TPA: SMP-30/gluconolactonase/LRE family protein [Croceibacterium sp.]|jgi:gluconolactonase|nr:SMP-30/gluconolactonase/LRE family protein [Croceibacterium sp.]